MNNKQAAETLRRKLEARRKANPNDDITVSYYNSDTGELITTHRRKKVKKESPTYFENFPNDNDAQFYKSSELLEEKLNKLRKEYPDDIITVKWFDDTTGHLVTTHIRTYANIYKEQQENIYIESPANTLEVLCNICGEFH